MPEHLDPEQLESELEANRTAALHRLASMHLEEGEAHFVIGCLIHSAPAAVQRALDSVQLHRDALESTRKARTETAPGDLCRCPWLGVGTPPHQRTTLCLSDSSPNPAGGEPR